MEILTIANYDYNVASIIVVILALVVTLPGQLIITYSEVAFNNNSYKIELMDFKKALFNKKNFITLFTTFLLNALCIFLCLIIYNSLLAFSFAVLFCFLLVTLTIIDFKLQILPDFITKTLIITGIVLGYFEVFVPLSTAIIGALVGYLSLWTINALFKLIRKKEGMGYGDFKLLAAIGAFTGYVYLPFIVFLASFLGIFIAFITLTMNKQSMDCPFPFGPALAVFGIVFLLFGSQITSWYLSLWGYY